MNQNNLDGFTKVVTPVETGVQEYCNYAKKLDSGFRRNDDFGYIQSFYESVNLSR